LARIKTLTLGDKVSLLPHPFLEEVDWLLVPGHTLLCDAITKHEQEWMAKHCDPIRDPEEYAVELGFIHSETDNLVQFANSMTLVSLVTRLQHAIRVFAKDVSNNPVERIGLVKNLETLNKQVGAGPVSIAFFGGLETVRDSIVHADSKAEWMRGKTKRSVPIKYRDLSLEWVHVTEAHIQEAVDNSIKQVKWYDDHF